MPLSTITLTLRRMCTRVRRSEHILRLTKPLNRNSNRFLVSHRRRRVYGDELPTSLVQ